MSSDIKFIFVGGCGRSGTTLVQKLLISHSKIQGGPEFDHTRDIFELYQKMTSDFFLDRQSFFYTKEKVKSNFKLFYESFFKDPFSKKPSAIYFSEKTPINIGVADTLLEIFPDAVFINVVRDGRDVLISYLNVRDRHKKKGKKSSNFSLQKITSTWNFAINKYLDILNTLEFSSRVFTIKFEDLLNNPTQILTELFDFLQLDMDDKLLNPEKITENDVGAKICGIWYTQEMYRQSFNIEKIGRWKSDLNFWGKNIGNIVMAKNLKRLGYETNPIYSRVGNVFFQLLKIRNIIISYFRH